MSPTVGFRMTCNDQLLSGYALLLASSNLDDEDDNPADDDPEETLRPWSSSNGTSRPQSPGVLSPDSACHSFSTAGPDQPPVSLSSVTCYGEAVWVGENGCAVNAGEEHAVEQTDMTTSDKTVLPSAEHNSLIRTCPIAQTTQCSTSPCKLSEAHGARMVVVRHSKPILVNTPQVSSSVQLPDGSFASSSSSALGFRPTNRTSTSTSFSSNLRTSTRFLSSSFPSGIYPRSRFTTDSVGSSEWRRSGHVRNCGKMLRCGACGKYYRNEYSLDHHICLKRKDVWKKGDVPSKIFDGQVFYFCPTCEKPFKWLGNLTRHYYVHTGQRFFKCDICPKEFFSAYQVKRHMNSHTGVRFKCEVCEKPFTCKYACAWHTRQHYTYVK